MDRVLQETLSLPVNQRNTGGSFAGPLEPDMGSREVVDYGGGRAKVVKEALQVVAVVCPHSYPYAFPFGHGDHGDNDTGGRQCFGVRATTAEDMCAPAARILRTQAF